MYRLTLETWDTLNQLKCSFVTGNPSLETLYPTVDPISRVFHGECAPNANRTKTYFAKKDVGWLWHVPMQVTLLMPKWCNVQKRGVVILHCVWLENSDICSCVGDIHIYNIQFIQLQSIWDRFSLNNITIKTFLISWTLQVSTISWSGPPVSLWDVLDLHQVALSLVCLLVGLREFVKCYDTATE